MYIHFIYNYFYNTIYIFIFFFRLNTFLLNVYIQVFVLFEFRIPQYYVLKVIRNKSVIFYGFFLLFYVNLLKLLIGLLDILRGIELNGDMRPSVHPVII